MNMCVAYFDRINEIRMTWKGEIVLIWGESAKLEKISMESEYQIRRCREVNESDENPILSYPKALRVLFLTLAKRKARKLFCAKNSTEIMRRISRHLSKHSEK